MPNYAQPDEFTGVLIEDGRFYVMFEHATGRSRVKRRIQLRPEDVVALRRTLDAFAALLDLPADASASRGSISESGRTTGLVVEQV